jgi:hypothetical protein
MNHQSEPGRQIVRRQIELRVLRKHVHHFMTINANRLADVADLVGKTNFQRVKTIARILHHLRRLEAVTNNGASISA